MIVDVLRDLWAEPAPSDRPKRSRFDLLLVTALAVVGLVDGLLSANVGWPAIYVPMAVVLPVALAWRHDYPLAVAAVLAGAYTALHGAMLVAGESSTMLNVGVIGLTLYALARWASGFQAISGFGLLVVAVATGGSTGLLREPAAAVGLPLFLGLFIVSGLAVRFRSSREAARLGEARMAERNRIARELHDTVAHHVSAIAIQAQAGREVLDVKPEATAEALTTIEEQASKTLAELRLALGVLRDREPAMLTSQSGVADILDLAVSPGRRTGSTPRVEVALSGDLESISPTVSAALYRLSQEAVTNARRHANGATLISVCVEGTDASVDLTVTDNGTTLASSGAGYGLLGMEERAMLLGGECRAGPGPDGGWVVAASLPRNGRHE